MIASEGSAESCQDFPAFQPSKKIRPEENLNFFITAFGNKNLKTVMSISMLKISQYILQEVQTAFVITEKKFLPFSFSLIFIQHTILLHVCPSLEFFISPFSSSATEILAFWQYWSGMRPCTRGRRETVFLRPAPPLGQRALDLHTIKIF
jgi:hypothetical protein